MKTVNEMKLCVPSKSCNEAFARCVVSAFVMSLDPTVNELSDLKTAVSEAVTNCIVHGYRHQSGTIYINGKITSENKVITAQSGDFIVLVQSSRPPIPVSRTTRSQSAFACI